MTSVSPAAVSGLPQVLVVEDDYFIADDMCRALQAAGVDIVGPVPTVRDAMDQLDKRSDIDAAVLDINLDGDGQAFPIADALLERGIPFVFATGYDVSMIPARFFGVKRFEKPCDPAQVLKALMPFDRF